MGLVVREPFASRPGQSLEDQIAELGALVNRLQADLLAQDRKHDQAIDALGQQTDEKLQAEHQHADAALNVVREELKRLREATTGGLHLEIDGVLGVLVGVIFTTWPDAVAAWLPGWVPPFRALMTGLFLYVGLRITIAYVRHYDARTTAQLPAGQHRRRRSA